jgi:NADPH:quinone reductase-like Zn-dependent oxidoreductase
VFLRSVALLRPTALLKFQWPRIVGFDFAGVVEQVGAGDESGRFKVGQRVFGMISGLPQRHTGTVAELMLVKARVCAECPAGLSFADCASIPLTGITAVLAFELCGLKEQPDASTPAPAPAPTTIPAPAPTEAEGGSGSGVDAAGAAAVAPAGAAAVAKVGPRVLVLGGAGGVGVVAIQLAKRVYGASFVATTASPGQKTELCQSLGADLVVNYRDEKFAEVLGRGGHEGFDAILDCTGEAKKCPSLLRAGGGLCSIAAAPTAQALREWMAAERMGPKDAAWGLHGFMHSKFGGWVLNHSTGGADLKRRCRGNYFHVVGRGDGAIMARLAGHMAAGRIRAVVDRQFTLADSADALAYIETGRAAGKVVVNVISDGDGFGGSGGGGDGGGDAAAAAATEAS